LTFLSSILGRSPQSVLDLFMAGGHRRGMPANALVSLLPPDRRQSQTALSVARGTTRLLHQFGFSAVSELPLPSGRRADLVALNPAGDIWIVEIKSSVEDFRADQKWTDYRLHCDRLFFATTLDVPCDIFPSDTGLIVADSFGARIVCEAPQHRLHASTRKSMMLSFARCAALRLQALADPHGPFAAEF
jgi:hypothetical protein